MSVNQEEVICKAKLLFTLADLPAKSALANCNQYNGEFGCLSCKHPGEQVNLFVCLFYCYGIPPILRILISLNSMLAGGSNTNIG